MSLPHLTPDMMAAFTQAAYDYDPACFCVFRWAFADFPPRSQYHQLPAKWLEVGVYHSTQAGQSDRFVLSRASDNAPDLLRQLYAALEAEPPPAPVAVPVPPPPPSVRQPGQGWIACAPQTTQVLPAFPVGFP
ncbi:MAG: hypothetical protein ACRYFX_09335 [Janthinobacterium lividum]